MVIQDYASPSYFDNSVSVLVLLFQGRKRIKKLRHGHAMIRYDESRYVYFHVHMPMHAQRKGKQWMNLKGGTTFPQHSTAHCMYLTNGGIINHNQKSYFPFYCWSGRRSESLTNLSILGMPGLIAVTCLPLKSNYATDFCKISFRISSFDFLTDSEVKG
jgi:hypothetical protein